VTKSERIPTTEQGAGESNSRAIADGTADKLAAAVTGLSQAEAKTRLAQYGFNELPEKRVNPLLKFLSYFWGPIAWMIEAAAILSAIVKHWEDFAIITLLLVGNAVVGFWEEY
jgi:H+-transporting ATPase